MQIKLDPDVAIARKFPEPVAIVITVTAQGRPNAMAVGWITVASGDPLMFVMGIDEQAYTFELIRETGQFVIAFPSEVMARETLHVGTVSGRDRDKLAECGLALQPATVVRPPLLADAVANFECELAQIIKPGDCPLVIGKTVAAHGNKDSAVRRLYALAPGHVLGSVRPA